ncbi:uncharacterized protein LOC18434949 isoform X2 [Amborella trichopoda]|uniref:uncharacterized protein LOC18434949 isoform X2 n=1 Tax=Amborella trichopoda TaxID=13333 RepID=UPI0009C1788F|nr:uncharacterized protein LOC18434949 isoform X2 [Amborella trichopoda]|eukprot:XP_020523464.1 uncharacterized protein LOC18434949 isoform X2 [Amborella trichopoda]
MAKVTCRVPACMVMVVLVLVVESNAQICRMSQDGFKACQPSVSGSSPAPTNPSKVCCKALASADLGCLCSYRHSLLLPSFGIDPDLAMQLPAKCNLTTPPQCQDLDPIYFDEACKSKVLKKAMDEEIEAIEKNDTWKLTIFPRSHMSIGVKWIYKTKRNANRDIARYKERLVAKGCKQRPGIDYDEILLIVIGPETSMIGKAFPGTCSTWRVRHSHGHQRSNRSWHYQLLRSSM